MKDKTKLGTSTKKVDYTKHAEIYKNYIQQYTHTLKQKLEKIQKYNSSLSTGLFFTHVNVESTGSGKTGPQHPPCQHQ